jgi:hypothetical protein
VRSASPAWWCLLANMTGPASSGGLFHLMDRIEMEEGLHGSPSPKILAVSGTDIMSPMPSVKAHSSWR